MVRILEIYFKKKKFSLISSNIERWRNYKEIVDIKEQYFNDELDITIESINIRYDMFKDELFNEFNEKLTSIKK
jgi:hypothetical protein